MDATVGAAVGGVNGLGMMTAHALTGIQPRRHPARTILPRLTKWPTVPAWH